MKIMFVDDEKNFLKLLEYFLKQEPGFEKTQLFWANDAKEARELLHAEGPFDIVVTDYHMPGEDGLSLSSFIRRLCPKTFLMILSSYENILDKARDLSDVFWTKPVDFRALAACLLKQMSVREASN